MIRLILFLFLLIPVLTFAQRTSPFNNLKVENNGGANYSFIVSGHFYGGASNTTGYPTNTLLANLDWINNSNSEMVICLGDLFMDIKNEIPKYTNSLFDKLEKPLFNAVGNHDLTGSIYQKNFGETFYFFELNNDIHCIIDTEIDDGDIDGAQLQMLEQLQQRVQGENFNNVFFYAHRTIWKDTYKNLDGLFVENTQGLTSPNFEDVVLPILKDIASRAHVIWFAGSLGPAPASFFYFKDEESSVTYIATAIRGLKRDAVLKLNVVNGEVNFDLKSFTGEELKSLEDYSVAYWKENVGKEPFNWRLLPLYVKQFIFNWSFWGAAILTSIIWIIGSSIRKRTKVKRSI
jgi:hypothetical protein